MSIIVPAGSTNTIVDDGDERRNGGHGDWYRPTERLKDSLGVALAQVRDGTAATQLTVEKTAAAGILQSAKDAAETQDRVERGASAAALANSLSFSNTQNLLISGFKDARFDSSQSTASILASHAACCCEIKEKITADGDVTRALVNSIEGRRADRAENQAVAEIQMLKLQLRDRDENHGHS